MLSGADRSVKCKATFLWISSNSCQLCWRKLSKSFREVKAACQELVFSITEGSVIASELRFPKLMVGILRNKRGILARLRFITCGFRFIEAP